MHSMRGHRIHVWCLGERMPHETHRIISMIVGQDKNHIPWLGVSCFCSIDLGWNRHYVGGKRRLSRQDDEKKRKRKREPKFHSGSFIRDADREQSSSVAVSIPPGELWRDEARLGGLGASERSTSGSEGRPSVQRRDDFRAPSGDEISVNLMVNVIRNELDVTIGENG